MKPAQISRVLNSNKTRKKPGRWYVPADAYQTTFRKLLLVILTLLVGNAAAGLACALAGSLALAAAALYCALLHVTGL